MTTDPSLRVSWSHADGAVAAVAGPGPLGIDVERRSLYRGSSRLVERALGSAEALEVRDAVDPDQAFLERWTMRESFLKAGVSGLIGSLSERQIRAQRKMTCLTFFDGDIDVVGSCVSANAVRFWTLDELYRSTIFTERAPV